VIAAAVAAKAAEDEHQRRLDWRRVEESRCTVCQRSEPEGRACEGYMIPPERRSTGEASFGRDRVPSPHVYRKFSFLGLFL
jgi:hypothetical protein